jgi:hypothetical protein
MICPTAGDDYTQVYQNNEIMHVAKWRMFNTRKTEFRVEYLL